MNYKQLKDEIKKGKYDEQLKALYIEDKKVLLQRERYAKAIDTFTSLYEEKDIQIYSAPGRSEVGGNHTDHQHGKVLAAAVNLDAIAVVAPTNNHIIKILSDKWNLAPIHTDDLDIKDEEIGTSEALVRGICARLKEEGYHIGGFHAFITSDVLLGAGLSSSACFEVLIGTILSGLYNEGKIDSVSIAKIGQYAENVYFKKPCGLMDQCASSVGGLIGIDFKDTKNPVVKQIEIDFESFEHSLCIVDTKGNHADLTDDYAAIPMEMKKVAAYFHKDVLREVDEKEFFSNIDKVRTECGDRSVLRALHFFQEEHRVDEEIQALETNNFADFKKIVSASGKSSFLYLQNVYSNADVQNQSVSVGLALSESILKNHGVCRVHGGGFAGTIQAFVENDFVAQYKKEMESIFGEGSCYVFHIRKYGGVQVFA